MPDMFPREKKYPCQLRARAGVGDLLKLAQAAVAPGEWFKKLDLSLAAPHTLPLDPPPTGQDPLSLWACPQPPMACCWLYSLLPLPSDCLSFGSRPSSRSQAFWAFQEENQWIQGPVLPGRPMGLLRQWQQLALAEHLYFAKALSCVLFNLPSHLLRD